MLRVVAVLLLIPSLVEAAPVLDRDLNNYTILGLRRVRLKNFAMEPPGCHVGVNCAQPDPNSPCGQLNAKHAVFGGAGQLVADNLCATESFFEAFKNRPASCGPDCSMIASPGPAADCTSPFVAPIVDNLDGDAAPSCSATCETDLDDIAAACGVTLPLPDCDASRPIEALPGMDCSANDVAPGNGACDLAGGTYGLIRIRNGARIVFAAGTTVACSVKAGKATRLTSASPAKVLVPAPGSVKINNTSDAGSTCGALGFVTERGPITFGRNGDIAVDACSLAGKLKLGHNNNLRGHFIGADVVMDFNNDGRCCSPAPPPSTTTTSTTNPGGSTTTTTSGGGGSTTSTTTGGGGSTTSTTTGGGGSTTSTTTGGGGSTTSTTTGGGGSTSTSTTLPSDGGFTRTIGFYKTHPAITAQILSANGPLAVCGRSISDIHVGHAHSALEALCVSPRGDQRLQLIRQLTGASLNRAAGGAPIDLGPCNAVCANPAATTAALTGCIDGVDAYNQSGDGLPAPWGAGGAADPAPCDVASRTPCTVTSPELCAAP